MVGGGVILAWLVTAASANEVSKGICYTPLASADVVITSQDDYMSEAAKPLWGPNGRGDLLTIKQLGANHVRMYGNTAENDHRSFLDYAQSIDLQVIAGISNYPLNQMTAHVATPEHPATLDNCNMTGGNCFDVVKDNYLQILQNGFATNGKYHPALSHLIVINEPDYQIGDHPSIEPWIDKDGSHTDPKKWVRATISAIDGILEAEKLHNVTGPLIDLTVTFTFAKCNLCVDQDPTSKGTKPGIGQMLELQRGINQPESYDYTPQNDIAAAYKTRFFNSMNTKNPFPEIKSKFLDFYGGAFPQTELLFEEYHCFWMWGYEEQVKDLNAMIDYAKGSSFLRGFNFFEFQESWQKPDFEEWFFGIFGMGTYNILDMKYFDQWTPVYCLEPYAFDWWTDQHYKVNKNISLGKKAFVQTDNVSRAVTDAFGGVGIDAARYCKPDPKIVPLSSKGYADVKSLAICEPAMKVFVQRIVTGLGGMATKNRGLESFVRKYCNMGPVTARRLDGNIGDWLKSQTGLGGKRDEPTQSSPSGQFDEMVSELRSHPSWAWWSMYAECVADRDSDAAAVGRTIEEVCSELWFDCVHVPPHCQKTPWLSADYALSLYWNELKAKNSDANPIKDCYFNGTATYASATYQYEEFMDESCVVSTDPASTPLDDQGYATVRRLDDPRRTAVVIQREFKKLYGPNATACSKSELKKFAESPPQSMFELDRDLGTQWWVCGGSSGNSCSPCEEPAEENIFTNFWFLLVVGVTLLVLLCATILTCIYARSLPEESEEWAKKHLNKAGYLTVKYPPNANGQSTAMQSAATAMPAAVVMHPGAQATVPGFAVYNPQGQMVTPATASQGQVPLMRQ